MFNDAIVAIILAALFFTFFRLAVLWDKKTITNRDRSLLTSLCTKHLADYYPRLLEVFKIDNFSFKRNSKVVACAVVIDCEPAIIIDITVTKSGDDDYAVKIDDDSNISEYRKIINNDI